MTWAPKPIPRRCIRGTSSSGVKCRVPLNTMCSRKWASPCWSSASISEPAWMCRRTDTRPGGSGFGRITKRSPLASAPKRSSGSAGMSLSACGQPRGAVAAAAVSTPPGAAVAPGAATACPAVTAAVPATAAAASQQIVLCMAARCRNPPA